jgi:hypothetical protein
VAELLGEKNSMRDSIRHILTYSDVSRERVQLKKAELPFFPERDKLFEIEVNGASLECRIGAERKIRGKEKYPGTGLKGWFDQETPKQRDVLVFEVIQDLKHYRMTLERRSSDAEVDRNTQGL